MRVEKLAHSVVKSVLAARQRWRRSRIRVRTSTNVAQHPSIYFFAPDFNEPAGGIRVIYRHVDILNRAGLNAFVLHQRRDFRCNWFTNETRVRNANDHALLRGDILVLPEIYLDLLDQVPADTDYVVFNQGVHLSWENTDASIARRYLDRTRLLGVVTVSDHSKAMLEYAFPGAKVCRVHNAIDDTLFYPGDAIRDNKIAYMPRRIPEDAHQIMEIARGRGALQGWDVVPLQGMSQWQVAAHLRKTKIFLAFTYQEGFGLPPAEAMACGNYVIGYHGFGGRELFQPQFSATVETGDIVGFTRKLEDAIGNERAMPGWCERAGRKASEFIGANYSLARESEEVVRYYSEFVAVASVHLARTRQAPPPNLMRLERAKV